MKILKKQLRPSVYIAAALVVASSFGSAGALAKMFEHERANIPDAVSLEPGSHEYEVRSTPQFGKSDCIGEIHTEVKSDGNYTARMTGVMRIALRGKKLKINLSGEGDFNSLGQLGGALLRFHTEDGSVVLGSTGVNPIQLHLRAKTGEEKLRKELTLPGPVELLQQENGRLRFRYRHFDSSLLMTHGQNALPLFGALQLSVVPKTEHHHDCEGAAAGYLALDQLFDLMQGLANTFGGA